MFHLLSTMRRTSYLRRVVKAAFLYLSVRRYTVQTAKMANAMREKEIALQSLMGLRWWTESGPHLYANNWKTTK